MEKIVILLIVVVVVCLLVVVVIGKSYQEGRVFGQKEGFAKASFGMDVHIETPNKEIINHWEKTLGNKYGEGSMLFWQKPGGDLNLAWRDKTGKLVTSFPVFSSSLPTPLANTTKAATP